MERLFLMFLDHAQRRTTVGRVYWVDKFPTGHDNATKNNETVNGGRICFVEVNLLNTETPG